LGVYFYFSVVVVVVDVALLCCVTQPLDGRLVKPCASFGSLGCDGGVSDPGSAAALFFLPYSIFAEVKEDVHHLFHRQYESPAPVLAAPISLFEALPKVGRSVICVPRYRNESQKVR
jgi:hypothetical protein